MYDQILNEILECRLRKRRGRRNMRCRKRRVKPWRAPPKSGSRELPEVIALEMLK